MGQGVKEEKRDVTQMAGINKREKKWQQNGRKSGRRWRDDILYTK